VIDWQPFLSELLTLAVIGASGVTGGLALGWRHPLLLAAAAVAVSGVVRVLTTLTMWTLGQYSLTTEAWWFASAALLVIGIWLIGFKFRREGGIALLTYGGLALVALATKYLFLVGERHHRDSVAIVEISLLIFQQELNPAIWEPPERRGLVYPLMLAVGSEGRLLSALTPLIFLSLLCAVAWLGRLLTKDSAPAKWWWVSLALVGAFSLTVPIFRVALTYLNGHTYMALGVLLITAAGLIMKKDGHVTLPTASLVVIGGILATTARIEGIVTVGVLLTWLVSSAKATSWKERGLLILPLALSGVILSWWLWATGSTVPDQFGVSPFFVGAISLAGAILVMAPLLDRFRGFLFPVTVAGVLLLLLRVPLGANDPFAVVMTQFNNVVLGYGGWGVSALTLGAVFLLLGWNSRSLEYRSLVVLSATLIFTTLFSKLFDGGGFGGGFGRDGFYDSVNRMWLHTLGVVAVTVLVGVTEFIRDMATQRSEGMTEPGKLTGLH
jgi:hypothetical protein